MSPELRNDPLIDNCFIADEIKDWADYISQEDNENDLLQFRKHCNAGRPLGDDKFIKFLERLSGRMLHKKKPGPKKGKVK